MASYSIRRNYIYNVCYQILLLLTPLITTPYTSRILGADGIGIVSYANSVTSYFTLFATMGIAVYGQREISYVQNKPYERSLVFWNTKLLGTFVSLIVLGIYFIFSFMQKSAALYLVLAFNILAVTMDITWFYQGIEEFGKIVGVNTLFRIFNILYIFIFVHTSKDIVIYAMGYGLFVFLGNLALWYFLPRYLVPVNFRELHLFHDIKVIFSLFIPSIAIQIYTVLDKTMIGLITKNSFENGYYEQAIKLSRMALSVVTAIGTVMIPKIGFSFKNGDTKEVNRLMYQAYRFIWFLGIPTCFGLIAISDNIVPWFYGPGYEKTALLIKILAFLVLAIGINGITGLQYLVPTEKQNLYTLSVMIGAVTNFVLNSILIRRYASLGAALASVIAETVIASVQFYFVRKELSWVKVMKESIHYVIAGTLMLLILLLISHYLQPSIVNSLIIAVSGILIYFSTLICLKDTFFLNYVLNIIKQKIR